MQAREGYQQGSVTDYPLTIRHRDGNLIDVLYNASVYKDVMGNVLGHRRASPDQRCLTGEPRGIKVVKTGLGRPSRWLAVLD